MAVNFLTIGEASRAAGVTPRTIRYYEELGLLGPSRKTNGGRNLYQPRVVALIRRIKKWQQEKFYPLKFIKQKLLAGVKSVKNA